MYSVVCRKGLKLLKTRDFVWSRCSRHNFFKHKWTFEFCSRQW